MITKLQIVPFANVSLTTRPLIMLLMLTAQTHAYATTMQLLIKDILEEVRYAFIDIVGEGMQF